MTANTPRFVHVERRAAERVAILTLDFERENRLSIELVAQLMAALDELERAADVGALVFTGADPKFFSNGLHLEWLVAHATQPARILEYLKGINALFKRVTLYPKPTIAALNGHTFAAGAFLVAHMDFRLMRADRGWVCFPEVDINIPLLPGMIAICQAVMPPQGFRQLYYTGRRFGAAEAQALGFVDEVCAQEALLPRAVELAAELGRKRTRTYAEMKRRIRAEIARILDEEDPPLFAATLSFSLPG